MSRINRKRPIPNPTEFYSDDSCGKFDSSLPRAGKWSPEEERFASRLIEQFEAGILSDCEDGCTLRSYLAKKLNCAPMRISKKFAGKCIGKHIFARKSGGEMKPFDFSSSSTVSTISDDHSTGGYSNSHSAYSSDSDSSYQSPKRRTFYVNTTLPDDFQSYNYDYNYSPSESSEEAAEWRDVLNYFCGLEDDEIITQQVLPPESEQLLRDVSFNTLFV